MSAPLVPIPPPANQKEFDAATIVVMERIRPVLMDILKAECEAQPWLSPASVMELVVILAMSGVYAYAGRDRAQECALSQHDNYEHMAAFGTGRLQ